MYQAPSIMTTSHKEARIPKENKCGLVTLHLQIYTYCNYNKIFKS